MGIWIGMLIGISFLEAPLKFQAPNITVPLGLGIGKLVFSALNKFEIVFSIVFIVWLYFNYQCLEWASLFAVGLPVIMVALQTFWLLPVLGVRADLLISGQELSKSYHHIYYVAMEFMKVGLLLFGYYKISNY